MNGPLRPRLRPVEIKRIRHEGRSFFYLRDLLALAGSDLIVPLELGPVLALLDGEHDAETIRRRCRTDYGLALSVAELGATLRTLEEGLLLEGSAAELAKQRAIASYRADAFRPARLAGRAYPANAEDLQTLLGAYDLRAADTVPLPAASIAGVLSPHIDYGRGGPIYAQGWRRAAAAVEASDSVIVLGTDHAGGAGRLTLTTQRYGSPLGVCNSWPELLDELVSALGPDEAFAEELHHRTEHSVELATVWLQHRRRGRPLRVLPVLCGHPQPYLECGMPEPDTTRAQAIAVLRRAVAGGALVVVAGDLAHVGPAFGDPLPFGAIERDEVRRADDALIAACAGGAEAMLAASRAIDDRYRVCGLSPLAIALAIMPPVQLRVCAYDQCSADDQDTSFVSVAGGCFVRAGG